MLNLSPLILFLKARRPHLISVMPDLFETTVPVKGYVNPKTGTYVAPTMARRKKRAPEAPDARPIRQVKVAPKAPRQGELFAPPDDAPRQRDLFDLLDEPALPEPQAAPKPASKPKPARPRKTRAPSSIPFGIPATATKKQRREWNADALRLLREHPEGEPWSDDDKAILARYSGQGGVGDSLNEYYTRTDVATAMWSLLGHLGYTEGPVLEPSCGTGVFLHTAPASAAMVGVDLDPVSSRIAGILHGGEVHTQSAETFATTDPRTYPAVIGNCPFGPRGELIAADKPHLPTAQQYFLDMAIDKAEAGGLVAMIVPTGIMDGMNTRGYRASLLRKAEFVAAYRLPNSAFAHSHTAVTTDIVVFRAYPKDTAGALSVVTDATLHLLAPELQEHFREGARRYSGVEPMSGGGRDHWPLVTVDGKLRLFISYHGREALNDHQVMLPTSENRAKAMAAALELERLKAIETNYVTIRGRTQASGLKCGYEQADKSMGYNIKTNPWHSILRELWGESAVAELNGAHQQAWRAELDQATSVSGVLKAVHFGLGNAYGKPVVSRALGQAVVAKLDQLGVLDQTMTAFHDQLAGEAKPSGAWGSNQSELLKLLELGNRSALITRNLLSHEWKQRPEG